MAIDYQSSFNSGELSGRMNGRSGLEVYGNGCSHLENFFVLPQGGIERRTGTEFIAQTNAGAGDGRARMIPFIFSSTQSYAVEFGDGYITVWDGSTPILVTDSSPYLDADLDGIDIKQRFDIMYIQHPEKPLYELRRETTDPTFSIQELAFDYPPLMDENETDILMSPSAVTGAITLTSSQDFFTEEHVGSSFAFSVDRTIANATVSDSFTSTEVSDPLYVSNAEWDFSSTGTWRGKVVIQKSSNKTMWEDFVTIGDTSGVAAGGQSNFSYASSGQERTGTWVRVLYVDLDGTFSFQLKTSDPWKTLVNITGYIDAKNVTAQVVDAFQDVPFDYVDWATATQYDTAKTGVDPTYVKNEASIDYSPTPVSGVDYVDLTAIDAGLADIVGSDFDGTNFWFVTNGVGNKKIYKVNSAQDTLLASYDISSDYTTVGDIAFYSNKLYVTGSEIASGTGGAKRFSLTGVYEATVLTGLPVTPPGLGYYNNYFYIITEGFATYISKMSTGWIYSGVLAISADVTDVTGFNGKLYACAKTTGEIRIYNESLVFLDSVDISSETTTSQGISHDGSYLWVTELSGTTYRYTLSASTVYYECMLNHLSTSFSADYDAGKWAVRTPAMETWSEGAFSTARGFPKAITFHEDRMWLTGSDVEPSTIHASVSGDYYNFATSTLSDSGIRRIPDNPEKAEWLVGRKRMLLGTEGGAIVVKSVDDNELITTDNIVTSSQAVFGASSVPAIEANDVIIYSERSNKKLREIIYNRDEENFRSSDMNILNNEILSGEVKELFLQQQPDQIVWAILADGDAACLTYERIQEVVGWARFITNGTIESACRLPSANSEDEIWMCVNRNGKYIIEKTRSRIDADWYVDSGIEAITGLSHLEGLEARCLVDGVNDGVYTVSGGEITPITSGSSYLVGMDYDSIMRTMPIEPNLMNKLPNSRIKGAVKCIAEFYPTKGGSIREKNKTGEIFDEVEFSGEKKFNIASDWTREKIIEIKQHLPYPMTILSLAVWTEAKGG